MTHDDEWLPLTNVAVPPTFLRFDRAELEENAFVIRATPADIRERRRCDHSVPLGYLYEITSKYEPETDLVMTDGHFDHTRLVWVFSGEITGIGGLTESFRRDDEDDSGSQGGEP